MIGFRVDRFMNLIKLERFFSFLGFKDKTIYK